MALVTSRRHSGMWRFALSFLLAVVMLRAVGDGAEAKRLERREPHMGTQFTIAVYVTEGAEAEADGAISAAFQRIAALDACMSDYRSDSELMQLCAAAPHAELVPISRDLWEVLRVSQRVSQASEGAFDVTVGHLTKLWRRARRQSQLPPADLLRESLERVGYQQIELAADAPRIRLTRPEVRIDLGGIAKGYAAQQALRVLQARGFEAAMVDAGGNIVVGAPPPGRSGWRIGIAGLQADQPPTRFLRLAHQSIATSGDLSQFVDIDGRRYSHILDPRTGLGLPGRSSVTVVASDGGLGDALATAINVLGQERGRQLVREFQVDVLYSWLEDGRLRSVETADFARFDEAATP